VTDAAAAPTPAQVDALAKALLKALDLAALKRMVYLATGDDLFEAYISPISTDPFKTMILNLLIALSKDGTTERFLTVVYREKPLNKEVRAAIAQFCPAATGNADQAPVDFQLQKAGKPQAAEAGAGPGLQKNIKPALKTVDLSVWIDRIEQVRKQVCRIELSGTALGTGFLVGANAVLTNCHVVEEARKLGATDKLGCRFDYRRLSNNTVEAGTVVAVRSIVDELPCSPAERTAQIDDPPPGAAELDYALLQLDPIPGADRGFIAMSGPPVQAGEALIIVQHPMGDPVRFAIDTTSVIGYTHGGRRLRYETNTSAGSSGSPCFNMDLDLVALHHLGDPKRPPPTYNQGIPIGQIHASIVARGHGALLPP
jgi:hypothetical protein